MIGAGIQSDAATQAAQIQAQAAQQALHTQVAASNRSASVLAPYVDVGTGALHSLADLYGIGYDPQGSATTTTGAHGIITPGSLNAAQGSSGGPGVEANALNSFQQSPDYKFAFDQGLQALQRSAAAGGTLISGGQLKAGEEFGQGLASQQYGNYYNRLLGLAQIGQGAASGSASNSLAAGNSIGNTQQAIGQASASGVVGSANAISGGLSGVSSSVMNSLLLSRLGGLGGSSAPASTIPSGTAAPSSLSAYTYGGS